MFAFFFSPPPLSLFSYIILHVTKIYIIMVNRVPKQMGPLSVQMAPNTLEDFPRAQLPFVLAHPILKNAC